MPRSRRSNVWSTPRWVSLRDAMRGCFPVFSRRLVTDRAAATHRLGLTKEVSTRMPRNRGGPAQRLCSASGQIPSLARRGRRPGIAGGLRGHGFIIRRQCWHQPLRLGADALDDASGILWARPGQVAVAVDVDRIGDAQHARIPRWRGRLIGAWDRPERSRHARSGSDRHQVDIMTGGGISRSLRPWYPREPASGSDVLLAQLDSVGKQLDTIGAPTTTGPSRSPSRGMSAANRSQDLRHGSDSSTVTSVKQSQADQSRPSRSATAAVAMSMWPRQRRCKRCRCGPGRRCGRDVVAVAPPDGGRPLAVVQQAPSSRERGIGSDWSAPAELITSIASTPMAPRVFAGDTD